MTIHISDSSLCLCVIENLFLQRWNLWETRWDWFKKWGELDNGFIGNFAVNVSIGNFLWSNWYSIEFLSFFFYGKVVFNEISENFGIEEQIIQFLLVFIKCFWLILSSKLAAISCFTAFYLELKLHLQIFINRFVFFCFIFLQIPTIKIKLKREDSPKKKSKISQACFVSFENLTQKKCDFAFVIAAA